MVRYFTSLFCYLFIALLLQVINVDLVRVITTLANFSDTGQVTMEVMRQFDGLFTYRCGGHLDFIEHSSPAAQAAISGIKQSLGQYYESNIEIMRQFVCQT